MGIWEMVFLVLFVGGLLSMVGYLIIWKLIFQLGFGLPEYHNLYRGCLTNTEFKALMEEMQQDPKLQISSYEISGGGYTAWVGNDYYGFKINGVKDFGTDYCDGNCLIAYEARQKLQDWLGKK